MRVCFMLFITSIAIEITFLTFSRYGREEPGIPSLMFSLGTTDPELYQRYQEGKAEVPGLHSAKFEPDYNLTIKTGVKAMSSAVLELAGN